MEETPLLASPSAQSLSRFVLPSSHLPNRLDDDLDLGPPGLFHFPNFGLRNGLFSQKERRNRAGPSPGEEMSEGLDESAGPFAAMRNSTKTLKCPKCNWHYKYQETLEIHMKEKHAEADVKCAFCADNRSHPKLARGETYSCGFVLLFFRQLADTSRTAASCASTAPPRREI